MGYLQRLVEKYKCWRNYHDWGGKTRYSMYSYEERCQRPGCDKVMIDSCVLTSLENGKYTEIGKIKDWRIKKYGRRR